MFSLFLLHFNTASVPIQLCLPSPRFQTFPISIQLLFLFNLPAGFRGQYPSAISIQLLFLFNQFFDCSDNGRFDFNTASVPIQLLHFAGIIKNVLFQYSFCSYSTIPPLNKQIYKTAFQYSFCSYSTGLEKWKTKTK